MWLSFLILYLHGTFGVCFVAFGAKQTFRRRKFHFWGSDFLGRVAYCDVVLDVDRDPEAPIMDIEVYDRCRRSCVRDHNSLASHKTYFGSSVTSDPDLPPIVPPIVDVPQPQIVTTPHPRIVPFVPIRVSPDPFYNRTATGHAPPPEINGYLPMFRTFGEWAQNEADTENHIRLEEFPFHYGPQQKTLIIHFFEWHYDAEVEEERAEFLRLNGHNRPMQSPSQVFFGARLSAVFPNRQRFANLPSNRHSRALRVASFSLGAPLTKEKISSPQIATGRHSPFWHSYTHSMLTVTNM